MAKLILKKNSVIIKEFILNDSEPSHTFGSNANNDFVISNKNVAGNHFSIKNMSGNYYLEDLGNPYGTNLNGRPLLEREQIVHGDEISVDELYLYFDSLSSISEKDKPAEDEIEIIDEDYFNDNVSANELSDSKEQSETHEFYELDELPKESLSLGAEIDFIQPEDKLNGKSYYLMVIHGPYLGKKYSLKFGDTKIGRDNVLNDIVIRNNEKGILDASISRRHATIAYKNGNFFVTDKRSKTRTYVNQVKLSATDEIPVYEGDEIEIVSDQKSTILRILADGDWDSSPPKKAGVWWIRNNLRLGTYLTILLGIITFCTLGLSCMTRISNNKKPGQLKFIEETWLQSEISNGNTKYDQQSMDEYTRQAHLGAADLNGDQKVDLTFANKSGSLTAVDGVTKKTIWMNDHFQVLSDMALVLSDLNANGLEDVLVVGDDVRLRALDGINGVEIWLSPILGVDISGPPVVADMNGDGLKDVLICTRSGKIHLGYGYITQMDWKVIETGLSIHSVPTSTDWDNDGINEIFIGTEEGKVLIIDGRSGNIADTFDFNEEISKATGKLTNAHNLRYPIALADIDRNQINDMLIGSINGNYLAVESVTLTRIWHDQIPFKQNSISENLAATVGRFNDDDIDDVVIVSNQAIKLITGSTDANNQKLVEWEYRLNNDTFITPVTLADFNKDRVNDIIIASNKGTIYILNGKNGEVISQIKNDNNPVISPLLAADIGSTGYLDIILIREDQNIYKIQSNSKINKNSVIWGQSYSNAQHTGRYEYTSPESTVYNIILSATGLLFLGVTILTISAKKSRTQLFEKNQNF